MSPGAAGRSPLFAIALALALGGCDSGDDRPLDPERHRTALRKLENILYRPSPGEPEDRKAIEDAADALAREIGVRSGARARAAAQALEAFSQEIGGQGEERFETVNLGNARAAWEDLRGRHFAPAAWLGETTPFLEQAQGGAKPSSEAAMRNKQDAEFVVDEMAGIIDRAEAFLQTLGPCTEAGDYERVTEAWGAWKVGHDNDVERAKESLDVRYHDPLRNTFRDLSALSAPLKGGPCNPSVNNDASVRVSRARAMLKRARESVARLRPPA